MLDLHADLRTTAAELSKMRALLERLVQAIERLSPPPASTTDTPPIYQSTLDDLHTIDDETTVRAYQERSALAERFGVMVDSPAFDRAVRDYEQEMRLHGRNADGTAIIDWDEAFTEAHRDLEGQR
jgi:hypothetical protein